ncbi:MAG TPA: inorganic phosphate transporter [Salinisphaeraceae bacterium]|nr:inorganic phosphate transporter [Salinisphaeraceae bacterium]
MEFFIVYSLLAAALGLFMAWGIGANDVANAMGTSIGSKVLSLRQAIIVAAIFEFLGAVLAGGQVTETIRSGIIDTPAAAVAPELLLRGMLAALAAAGTWLLIATSRGWPVSTTHAIVGAIIGFAVVGMGAGAVHWPVVGAIAASWVVSPILGGLIAFLLFTSVRGLILNKPDPLHRARLIVPFYMFLGGFVVALMTLLKGLKNIGLDLTAAQALLLALAAGLVVSMIGIFFIRRIPDPPDHDHEQQHRQVEKVFAVLMVLTACAIAFAHGSNDVANAVGPLAAIISIIENGKVTPNSNVPLWILLLGGIGIVIGLATYGRHVIATIGKRITHLTPSRGFAAELAAASTVVLASGGGLPVSTTQILVGAVLGVGFARGIAAINLNVVRSIFLSWAITLPAGAALATVYFYLFRLLPGV